MKNWKRAGTLAATAAALAGLIALAPQTAEAQHRGGRGRPIVVVSGFHGSPFFGYGYGPYWGWGPWGYYGAGPFAYQREGGVDLGYAMMAGYGAVDLNVKPGQAEVWVDGKFVAEARNLDGYPSFLWLKEGAHRVQIYKGGFATFDEQIDVDRGVRKDLKVRLEQGDSQPPGVRPKASK